MRRVAAEIGAGDTFRLTPVGVFFGRPGRKEPGVEVEDRTSAAPARAAVGCVEVGECMTGCWHGAKNSLVKNYLYLAEQAGAVVHPETTVTQVRPRAQGGYAVQTARTEP